MPGAKKARLIAAGQKKVPALVCKPGKLRKKTSRQPLLRLLKSLVTTDRGPRRQAQRPGLLAMRQGGQERPPTLLPFQHFNYRPKQAARQSRRLPLYKLFTFGAREGGRSQASRQRFQLLAQRPEPCRRLRPGGRLLVPVFAGLTLGDLAPAPLAQFFFHLLVWHGHIDPHHLVDHRRHIVFDGLAILCGRDDKIAFEGV